MFTPGDASPNHSSCRISAAGTTHLENTVLLALVACCGNTATETSGCPLQVQPNALFGLGVPELAVIGVVAALVFGKLDTRAGRARVCQISKASIMDAVPRWWASAQLS